MSLPHCTLLHQRSKWSYVHMSGATYGEQQHKENLPSLSSYTARLQGQSDPRMYHRRQEYTDKLIVWVPVVFGVVSDILWGFKVEYITKKYRAWSTSQKMTGQILRSLQKTVLDLPTGTSSHGSSHLDADTFCTGPLLHFSTPLKPWHWKIHQECGERRVFFKWLILTSLRISTPHHKSHRKI